MKKVEMKNKAGAVAEFPENQASYMEQGGWKRTGATSDTPVTSAYAEPEPATKPADSKPENAADNAATVTPAQEANNGTR